jgi:hypothetical protein
MLTSEFHKTYEREVGKTVVTVVSECDEDTREDIIDALIRLIKRDIANLAAE